MIFHDFNKDYYLENVICGNGFTYIVEAPLKKKRSLRTDEKFLLNITDDENI
jgi:hypothetical protein